MSGAGAGWSQCSAPNRAPLKGSASPRPPAADVVGGRCWGCCGMEPGAERSPGGPGTETQPWGVPMAPGTEAAPSLGCSAAPRGRMRHPPWGGSGRSLGFSMPAPAVAWLVGCSAGARCFVVAPQRWHQPGASWPQPFLGTLGGAGRRPSWGLVRRRRSRAGGGEMLLLRTGSSTLGASQARSCRAAASKAGAPRRLGSAGFVWGLPTGWGVCVPAPCLPLGSTRPSSPAAAPVPRSPLAWFSIPAADKS